MMAISRFRFALLLLSILVADYSFVGEASAHRSVVEQVVPDEDGDGPLAAAGGGSSGPVLGRKPATLNPAEVSGEKTVKLDLLTIVLLFSKSFGLVL